MSLLTITSSEARSRFRELLEKVFSGGTQVVIERYNQPKAVLVNYNEWLAAQKALQAQLLAAAKGVEAREDAAGIPLLSHAELKRRIAAKEAAKHVDP